MFMGHIILVGFEVYLGLIIIAALFLALTE